jgi:hypothetical protein
MKTVIVVSANNVRRIESDDEADESEGNLDVEGLEVDQPKTLDDDASERSKHTIRCSTAEYNRAVHPSDGIEKCFADMGSFDVVIGDAAVVDSDTFEGNVALSVV